MPSLIDLTGQVFGRLTVVGRAGSDKHGKPVWLCRCTCGVETTVKGLGLRRGGSRSCGCLQRDKARAWLTSGVAQTTHGFCVHPEYGIWKAMIERCTQPKHRAWSDYGGRGISVCARWQGPDGFPNFLADVGPRPPGVGLGGRALYSIDRRDNDGNYEPSNCRWATSTEQRRNRRA